MLAAIGLALSAGAGAEPDASELLDLSIEELANLKIRSASRLEESVRETPAAVFVITADEIRRSGVTSIPEALRLAPGVEVARRNTYEWSISIRGFNGDLSNKLLVLIDGRSVYSPLYAGVFWDAQDTLLEDVERIEIISGPGGTLWGANAVNGVINILTRQARDTTGGYGELLGGNEDRMIGGFRFGGEIGKRGHARAYVRHVDRDSSRAMTGGTAVDDAQSSRAGFRADWDTSAADRLTATGDVYAGTAEGIFPEKFTIGTVPTQTIRDEVSISGANLLGRWQRNLGVDSDLQLQFYVDRTKRDVPNIFDETRDTLDLDFQHRLPVAGRHDFLWGLTFRQTRDGIGNTTIVRFEPASRSTERYGAFFQDRVALVADELDLTIGSKLESNEYTGFEYQPSLRLSWHPDHRHTVWGALSRAVRIPSRLDDDLLLTVPFEFPGSPLPVYVVVEGRDDFQAEELVAAEAGYRFQPSDVLSLDVALFHNDYEKLQTVEPDPPFVVTDPPAHLIIPAHLDNGMRGNSVGGTVAANWQPRARWRVRLQYSHIDLDLQTTAGSQAAGSPSTAGNSPRHQAAAHAFVDLSRDVTLYAGLRYVDELPSQGVDAYVAADVNVQWALRPDFAISLAIRNLADDTHPEFGSSGASLIERSAYLKLDWSF